MTERGLRVLEQDKTFFGKITGTITKLLIPTKVGINGLLIYAKRNNMLKAFENYTNENNHGNTVSNTFACNLFAKPHKYRCSSN